MKIEYNFLNWIKNTCVKIWEGFLQNIGIYISVFLFSGGYLVAINKIKLFRDWIKGIPTEWVLTPFVLSIIIIVALFRVNRKQKLQLSKMEKEPPKDERDSKFVTHCGMWWKIYFDSEYIEDFPYCTCCDPRKKLAQIEWYPEEVFQCPITKATFKLFGDEVPLKRHKIVSGLYRAYFKNLGSRVENNFYEERNLLKELNPQISDKELFDKLFQLSPLNRIPKEELEDIQKRYPNPEQAFNFIERHFIKYKKYLIIGDASKRDG